MNHPFQHLCVVSPTVHPADRRFLIAACGPKLFSVEIGCGGFGGEGDIKSRWSSEQAREKTEDSSEEPKQKKRKLNQSDNEPPAIIKLAYHSGAEHIAVVTEDKCITVFSIEDDGSLKQLNQRCMPKRPCAIAMMSGDSETLICGDKFGDVYSLPLIISDEESASHKSPANGSSEPKLYTPSATEMTVHTLRNRKALEEQLRAKGRPTQAKEALAFEHKLLLGHVSMLTDMQITDKLDDDSKLRPRIITCDRDEHIRVSRGIPQSHIIENFCMGHTEFLSKLLVLPSTEFLLSGGGDDWMGVWNWRSGQLLAKHDLSGLKPDQRGSTKDSVARIAVQNIWWVHGILKAGLVIVKAEGSSALAVIEGPEIMDPSATVHIVECADVGEILDLVSLSDGEMIVSTDDSSRSRLHCLKIRKAKDTWELVRDEEKTKMLAHINGVQVVRPDSAKLDSLLHGVEKLRKQDFDDDQEG